MRKIMVLLALLIMPGVAEAQRYAATKGGKPVVAHTRIAPVVVHKVLPPYGLGLHVYAGRTN